MYISQHKLTSSVKKHFKFFECGHQNKTKAEEPRENRRRLRFPCGRISEDSPMKVKLYAENNNMAGVKISMNGDLSIGVPGGLFT